MDRLGLAFETWRTLAPLRAGLGASVSVVRAVSPCGQDDCCKEASSLSLSRAGREMSCMLAEVRLPVCCRGQLPALGSRSGGRGCSLPVDLWSKLLPVWCGSVFEFLKNSCFIVIWHQMAAGGVSVGDYR